MCAPDDTAHTRAFRDKINKYTRLIKHQLDSCDENDLRTVEEKLRSKVELLLRSIDKLKNMNVKLYLRREELKEHCEANAEILKNLESDKGKVIKYLQKEGFDPLIVEKQIREREKAIAKRYEILKKQEEALEKTEQEVLIKQEDLRARLSDMELALKSRYTLTSNQKKVMLVEKDMILDGIAEWGSVTAAVKHNKNITSKPGTIMMYATIFPEFQKAIDVSKALFRDKAQALLVDRAINGTSTPVFNKGEYRGNYDIVDNKLLLKVLEAEMPEKYGKRVEKGTTNNTQNNVQIISYAGVDETKFGYKKNIGLVTNVQDSGKVERITQEEKMRRFYEDKEDTEIIEADVEEEEEEDK